MPEKPKTLGQAVALCKAANAKKARRDETLKAAVDYVIAKDSDDAEFKKKASANLAAVLTKVAVEKIASLAPKKPAKPLEKKALFGGGLLGLMKRRMAKKPPAKKPAVPAAKPAQATPPAAAAAQ